jgi:hypothetical protein
MPNLHKLDAEKVRIAGLKMSNWLYNIGQSDRFTSVEKKAMREMVDEWDRESKLLRKKD